MNNTESLIDYTFTDFYLINDIGICDSFVKNGNFATLSLSGLHIETKNLPDRKSFYDKNNYHVSDFKHCLEQQNWQKIAHAEKLRIHATQNVTAAVFTQNVYAAVFTQKILLKLLLQHFHKTLH